MTQLIPPPEPHNLLPGFLACLPTAFASTRPPPALLPLLSPILRQRVQLLNSPSASRDESWLKLLCWNGDKADRLQTIVEKGTWEPHPVSGEIEVDDIGDILYKRFDEETLRAQLPLPSYDLTVVYLWCDEDQGNNGWRVAELLPLDSDLSQDPTWSPSISEANALSSDRILSEALRDAENAANGQTDTAPSQEEEEEEDDDYWAQYDQTPGRTPAVKRSPAPQSLNPRNGSTEDDYYSRYSEVQPALDAHDPSEEAGQDETINGQSSLNGDTFSHLLRRQSNSESLEANPTAQNNDTDATLIPQPRASRSPSSTTGSDHVARLEQNAAIQSDSEIGVRQHISTSMKSMYRLARATGMEREEFLRIVQREVEVLGMLD